MAKKKAEVEAEVAAAEKTVREAIAEKDAEIEALREANRIAGKMLSDKNERIKGLEAIIVEVKKNSGVERIAVLEGEIRDYEKTLQAVRVDLDKAQKMIASLQRVI